MKEQSSIPTGKVQRATRFISTGAKVGTNYLKYYAKKAVSVDGAKEQLDKENAEDIYNAFSQLKGSALKVAQIMSMDKVALPKAYADKFAMAQYSAPPLSYPLVVKTFKDYFGQSPDGLFDTFSRSAVNAASIGQVHKATKNGKSYAVKVQYPGVADSVKSDLKLVKPFALKILNVKEKDLKQYFEEVESKLLEETDYTLELKQSEELTKACAHLPNVFFPSYYPEWSARRVLTMDWIDGIHLDEFIKTNPSQEQCDIIGQTLWDFFDYQIYTLRKVHADPHPGNFLIDEKGRVGIIDFGCVKEIPEFFFSRYFALLQKGMVDDEQKLEKIFYELEFLFPNEGKREKELFTEVFKHMISLLGKPFHNDVFDFGDNEYFNQIFEVSERLSKDKEIRSKNGARGSRHGLYINRTYFGLYSILNQLGAKVRTRSRLVA